MVQEQRKSFDALRSFIRFADIIQVIVLIIVVAISYTKMGSRVDSVAQQAAANAALMAQMHESLDSVRARTSATPEAERRLSLIEQRITMLEADRAEFKRDVRNHLERLEDKIDTIIERQR